MTSKFDSVEICIVVFNFACIYLHIYLWHRLISYRPYLTYQIAPLFLSITIVILLSVGVAIIISMCIIPRKEDRNRCWTSRLMLISDVISGGPRRPRQDSGVWWPPRSMFSIGNIIKGNKCYQSGFPQLGRGRAGGPHIENDTFRQGNNTWMNSSELRITGTLWGESTGDRWSPLTNGQ